jgi:hypothetical protein
MFMNSESVLLLSIELRFDKIAIRLALCCLTSGRTALQWLDYASAVAIAVSRGAITVSQCLILAIFAILSLELAFCYTLNVTWMMFPVLPVRNTMLLP